MTLQQLFRVVSPSQDLFIRQQVMDARVAFLANPQAAFAHLLDGKAAAESILAVAVARNEVVECQVSSRSFAQLTGAVHSMVTRWNTRAADGIRFEIQ